MRSLFLTIIVALCYGLTIECVAQNVDVLPGSEYKSIVRFGENNTTAPSRFGRHILISVSVNGSPMEVALDTGSSYSLITSGTAEELKLKRVKGKYVGCRVQEYVEARIQIGNIVIENQRLCASLQYGLTSRVTGEQVRVPGLLGYDFLRNFVVEVDYFRGVVLLHNPGTFKYHLDKSYVGKVPFRLVNGTPHIEVSMVFGSESRQKIEALLDTGSWQAIMVTEPMLDVLNKTRPYRWEFGRNWVLNIQGFSKFEPSNLAGPINFDAVLGNPALVGYKVIFDYPQKQLILSDSLIR